MAWLLSKLYDRVMAREEAECLGAWRRDLLGDLRGDVLEIGAGTGVNLAYYGEGIERLVLAEPDRHMRARLQARVDAEGRACEIVDTGAHPLAFDDAAFDVAVFTLVLCTVPDPLASLREAHRVLRPGGSLVFIEHVAAEEGCGLHRRQRLLEPLWRLVAGNCHVTRHTRALITAAGFDEPELTEHVKDVGPRITSPTIRGRALRPIG